LTIGLTDLTGPVITEGMRGSAWREGVGDGEQRGEHQQPDDYGPPLQRWQGTAWKTPPGAVVVLITQVVELPRTARRAFSAPEFERMSTQLTPFIATQ